jgi:hypothetical protein
VKQYLFLLSLSVESKYQSFASRLFRRKKTPPNGSQSQKDATNGGSGFDSGFLEELPGEGYRYNTGHRFNSLVSSPSSTPSSSLSYDVNGGHHRDRSSTFAVSGPSSVPPAACRQQRTPLTTSLSYDGREPLSGFQVNNVSRKTPRRVVLAAVVYEEWLHELASLALEHSLAGEEFSFFFPASSSSSSK